MPLRLTSGIAPSVLPFTTSWWAVLPWVVLPLAACGGSQQGPQKPERVAEAVHADPIVPMASASAVPSCAEGTTWNGSACVTAAPTESAPVEPPPAPPPAPRCPDGMALVPGGGPFKIGAPKVEVSVSDYCLDKTEVTADAYRACVKEGDCKDDFLKCGDAATYGVEGKGDHPIVCVDFKQAETYCAAQNKRLPTQAEWEWAARGGAAGSAFPWGDDTPKAQACWSGNGLRTGTCAVGSFPAGASKEGLLDLAGNVFEWTTAPTDARSPMRVGRGGSWKDGVAGALRADRPGGFAVTYRCGFLGIRCATEAKAQ